MRSTNTCDPIALNEQDKALERTILSPPSLVRGRGRHLAPVASCATCGVAGRSNDVMWRHRESAAVNEAVWFARARPCPWCRNTP